MATNDENTDPQTITQDATATNTQTITVETKQINDSNTGNIAEDKLQELFDKFNTKVDELTSSYNKKIDDLQTKLDDKTKEVEKLQKVNAQILMNTTVNKDSEITDFTTVDFNDVNWDNEASKYMANLDNKIF